MRLVQGPRHPERETVPGVLRKRDTRSRINESKRRLMMQIQWQDGVRVHGGCGGEAVIVPGQGYICTACGEQSFSDIPSDEEQERQAQEDKEARERERDESMLHPLN
jgi:hypothetical protein